MKKQRYIENSSRGTLDFRITSPTLLPLEQNNYIGWKLLLRSEHFYYNEARPNLQTAEVKSTPFKKQICVYIGTRQIMEPLSALIAFCKTQPLVFIEFMCE